MKLCSSLGQHLQSRFYLKQTSGDVALDLWHVVRNVSNFLAVITAEQIKSVNEVIVRL